MTGDYAVVPVRSFSDSKLRLKNTLSQEQRIALTGALLKRVAKALALSRMTATIIVATNPIEVLQLVGKVPKVRVIGENRLHGGVNNAMESGIECAREAEAETVTLLPSDLPLLNHKKVDAVLDALHQYDLVINGSQRKDGTNLLAMRTSVDFVLHYDDDSFVKHAEGARARKLNFLPFDFEEFSHDLDDSEDLSSAMNLYGTKSFVMFLRKVTERGI